MSSAVNPSDGAQVVEKFLGAFSKGDLETALSCFDSTTVVVEAHGMPFSGTYVGTEGFMEILGKMSTYFEPVVNSVEILDAGSKIVGKMNLTFTSKASGESLSLDVVELYDVEGGVIKHADVYYKDPAGIAALAG